MLPINWVSIAAEDIADVVLTRRRKLKELAQSGASDRRSEMEETVDEILRLSVDAVPPADWPISIVAGFVQAFAALSSKAILDLAGGNSAQLSTLQSIADLLLGITVVLKATIDSETQIAACRCWMTSRLAMGIEANDVRTFRDQVLDTLATLGFTEQSIVLAIDNDLGSYSARRRPQFSDLPSPSQESPSSPLAPTSTSAVSGTALPPPSIAQLTPDAVPSDQEEPSPQTGVATPLLSPQQPAPAATTPAPPAPASLQPSRVPPPIAQRPLKPKAKASPIREWKTPFQNETMALAQFPACIDNAVGLADALGGDRSLTKGLVNSKNLYAIAEREQFPSWKTSRFVVMAAESAADIAASLLDHDGAYEAYTLCNFFAELTKLPLARDAKTSQTIYERLLGLACRAVAQARLSSAADHASFSSPGDVQLLLNDLHAIMRRAVGTYFRAREKIFTQGRVDAALVERLVNNVIATYFDKRLASLLDHNRPHLRAFISSSMPVVYHLRLSPEWTRKKAEWRKTLEAEGYGDAVNLLVDMGDLVDPSEVGSVSPDVRSEVASAAARTDYARVAELLADSAKELRAYLFGEAQRLFQYRRPARPRLTDDRARRIFEQAYRFTSSSEPDKQKKALKDIQQAWQIELNNLDLMDWVAYLHARTGNLQSAGETLDRLQLIRGDNRTFATDWNLAVLRHERQNDVAAYQLVLPLLDSHPGDQELVLVILALALKLADKAGFLKATPRTLTVRYHPLAVMVANELGATKRVEQLLSQLLGFWHSGWELPSVDQRFQNDDLLEGVVKKAVVEGQTDLAIAWLEARIHAIPTYVPNYQALAFVHEHVMLDYDAAFRALEDRLAVVRENSRRLGDNEEQLRFQRIVDQACEEVFELCRRKKREDLGRRAYELSRAAGARSELLESFREFAPPEEREDIDGRPTVPPQPTPQPLPPSWTPVDPKLADRIMWVNAALVKIRNINSYLDKAKEIEEFTKIVAEVGPTESDEVLNIIGNIRSVLATFSRTHAEDSEDRATRRTLYTRVAGYERQLAQLLSQDALTRQLTNLITPFRQALQLVLGDLSRQAGVGPDVDVTIENSFISNESPRSTLVLRVTDRSERPVTDVSIEIVSEHPAIRTGLGRKLGIPKLESQRSELVTVPVEWVSVVGAEITEVTFAISLRASAEGSTDVDLPIKRITIPLKTFSEVIGADRLPKLFSESPLRPSDSELFHGRTGLLDEIRNTFSAGSQSERYFFDGIRRVGKTSLLNFLPDHLPSTVFPVIVNLDNLAMKGRFSSAMALEKFSRAIADASVEKLKLRIDVPALAEFDADPGQAFKTFLSSFASAVPNRTPLLMIDEFQDLLSEISRSGVGRGRDTVVLDLLRGALDDRRLAALFTGSVRFDYLPALAGGEDKIFGSLVQLRVSFLSPDSVGEVLSAGMRSCGSVPPETVTAVYEMTGGYSWHVQKYGLELINRLNEERRTVSTPTDVEDITKNKILTDDSLFKFWWDIDQLREDEERFVEWLLRKHPTDEVVATRGFMAEVPYRERDKFTKALRNLLACEILDSRQTEYLRFGGRALKRWLVQHTQDGRLRIPHAQRSVERMRGKGGIFIDHENMYKALQEIGKARGNPLPEKGSPQRLQWFRDILERLVAHSERVLSASRSDLSKVAVSFWHRPAEAELGKIYQQFDFDLRTPEETGKGNEVDFKLADEFRRAREQAQKEDTSLTRAVIVTGDIDLSHSTRALRNDGVDMRVVAGDRNIGDQYILLVGRDNYTALQDIAGL